jgi:Ca2+/H+ antiporter, TMEM165/GDT1 family
MRRSLRILKVLLIVAAAAIVFGFVVEMLWNWLMPAVFGLHAITYWQALGLFLLGKILFGGFRGRPGWGGGHWRHRMKERWESMTPEERERFRQGMKERCGRFAAPPRQTT